MSSSVVIPSPVPIPIEMNNSLYGNPMGSMARSPPHHYPDLSFNPAVLNLSAQAPIPNQIVEQNVWASNPEMKLYFTKAAYNTSTETSTCAQCSVEFGFFKRRHQCSCCNQNYCGTCCTKNGKVVKYGLPTGGKVCDNCHIHLFEEDPNCVRRVTPCLSDPKINLQRQAISEIYELLTMDAKYSKGLATSSFLSHLLPIVEHHSDDYLKLFAVRILAKLVEVPENVVSMLNNPQIIPIFIRYLKDVNEDLILEAGRGLSYICDNSGSFPQIINSGGIPVIISALMRPNEDFRQWVSLIILKLSHNDNCGMKLHESFGVPAIISLLSSNNHSIVEYATGTLVQLIKIDLVKKSIFEAGGISFLISLIKLNNYNENVKAISNSINCIYTFILNCEMNDTYFEAAISSGIISNFLEVLRSTSEKDTVRILAVFYSLIASQFHKRIIPDLLGGLSLFVDLLSSENTDIQNYCLSLLLAMSTDSEVKVLIRETSALPKMLSAITTCTEKQKLLLIICNLTKDDDVNIDIILSTNEVPKIIACTVSENLLVQIASLNTILSLSSSPKAAKIIHDISGVQALIAVLSSPHEPILESALRILNNFSKVSYCKDNIFEFGGVHYITSLLGSQFPIVREECLKILEELSLDHRMITLAIQTNSIRILLNFIVNDPSVFVKDISASILINLAKESQEIREFIHHLNGEQIVISLLHSQTLNNNVKFGTIEVLAYYSTEQQTRLAIASSARILLQLVFDSVINQNEIILVNIITTISNIAVDFESAVAIMNCGGIQTMLGLLSSPFDSVRSNTILAIGNMSRSATCREAILQNSVLEKIAQILCSASDSIKQKCVYTIHMLSYSPRSAELLLPQRGALQQIVNLVTLENKSSVNDALLTILNLSQFNNDIWKIFVELGGIPMLLVLASSSTPSVQKRAADELGTLTLLDEQRELIFKLNGIDTLVSMLSSPEVSVQESILTAIANLSSNQTSWSAIIKSGGISTVLSFLSPQDNYKTQLSSSQIIANISTSEENLLLFQDSEVITRLIDVLNNALSEKQYPLIHNINQSLSNLVSYQKNTEIIYSYSCGISAFHCLLSSSDENFQIAGASAVLHLASQSNIRKSIMNDVNFSSSLNIILSSQNQIIQQIGVQIISALSEESDLGTVLLSGNSLALLISLLKEIQSNIEKGCNEANNSINIILSSIEIVTMFEEIRKVILQTDILQQLVTIIQNNSKGIQSPVDILHCFNIISNLSIEEACKQSFDDENILNTILTSLHSAKQTLHISLYRSIVLLIHRLCFNGLNFILF